MTLDEAIEHAKEQSKEDGLCECGLEHIQLAEWLIELRMMRKHLLDQYMCPKCFAPLVTGDAHRNNRSCDMCGYQEEDNAK